MRSDRDVLLSEFTRTCKQEFAFLESDFGLALVDSGQSGHEFSVAYANKKHKVTIHFEYPGPPWIAVEKKETERWKRKGLHQLYKRAFKKPLPEVTGDKSDSVAQYDLSNLKNLSETLRNSWSKLMAAF